MQRNLRVSKATAHNPQSEESPKQTRQPAIRRITCMQNLICLQEPSGSILLIARSCWALRDEGRRPAAACRSPHEGHVELDLDGGRGGDPYFHRRIARIPCPASPAVVGGGSGSAIEGRAESGGCPSHVVYPFVPLPLEDGRRCGRCGL